MKIYASWVSIFHPDARAWFPGVMFWKREERRGKPWATDLNGAKYIGKRSCTLNCVRYQVEWC